MLASSALADSVARRIAHLGERNRRRETHALPRGCGAAPALQLAAFLYRPTVFLEACRDRYGPTFSLRLPGLPRIATFTDPRDIKDVFAASGDVLHAGEASAVLEPFLGPHSVLVLDGREHAEQRKLLLPPFRGDRMRAYGEAMRDITRARMARLSGGDVIRMHPETQAITLGVILRTVFGMKDGPAQDRMRPLLAEALGALESPIYLVRSFQRDLGPRSPWGRFLRLRAEIYDAMGDLVEERRREADQGEDILSMLLAAEHEDGSPMSDVEIRDELLTLLIAGHETTATALTWAMHRLTLHPDVLARIWAELDRVFPDRQIDPRRSSELSYLDAFIKEVLRVHPVVPGVGRVVKRPIEVGGRSLPLGALVICSIYLAHRDPATWPDPERFDPTRFVGATHSPWTYLPFGGGLRRCIGEAFALYEMRIVLATILAELEPIAVARDVRIVRRNVTLTPRGGLPIRFRRRR